MYYLDIIKDNEIILSLFWKDEDIPSVIDNINDIIFSIEMHTTEELKFVVYHC